MLLLLFAERQLRLRKRRDLVGSLALKWLGGRLLLVNLLDMTVLQEVPNEAFIPSSQLLSFRAFTRNPSFENEVFEPVPLVECLNCFANVKSYCALPVWETDVEMEHKIFLEPVVALSAIA